MELLADHAHRRNLLGLWGQNLKAVALPWLLLGVAVSGAVAWSFLRATAPYSAAQAFDLLGICFGIGGIAAGLMLYAPDQQAGTFELLWLATGSERALLRLKILTLLPGLILWQAIAVGFAAWYLDGLMAILPAVIFLATTAWFLLAWMAWAGTLLPNTWASGLFGAGLAIAGYLTLGTQSVLSPFANPFLMPQGTGITNRVMLFFLTLILLEAAATRLRKAL